VEPLRELLQLSVVECTEQRNGGKVVERCHPTNLAP
jgi:hypothetical protein